MSFERAILIVDDDPVLRFTISVILKRAGYRIAAIACGEEAVRQLELHRFDILILDLSLPDISGLDLLGLVRGLQPALPVLVLTGDDSVEATLHALRLGARAYLLKPLKPGIILDCIDRILKETAPGQIGLSKSGGCRRSAQRSRHKLSLGDYEGF